MEKRHDDNNDSQKRQLIAEVEYLAGETKLLAMNLAIALARIKDRQKVLRDLDPEFTELIKRANDSAGQVDDVLQAFQNQKKMIYSLPASSKIIERRGAYDKIEASLQYVYALSRQIIESIRQLQQSQKQAG